MYVSIHRVCDLYKLLPLYAFSHIAIYITCCVYTCMAFVIVHVLLLVVIMLWCYDMALWHVLLLLWLWYNIMAKYYGMYYYWCEYDIRLTHVVMACTIILWLWCDVMAWYYCVYDYWCDYEIALWHDIYGM